MTYKLAKTLVLLFCSTALFSHEFNPAHLVVNELTESEYEVSWMYPIKNIGARADLYSFFQKLYQANQSNLQFDLYSNQCSRSLHDLLIYLLKLKMS